MNSKRIYYQARVPVSIRMGAIQILQIKGSYDDAVNEPLPSLGYLTK